MLVSVDLFNALAVRIRLRQSAYCAVLDRGRGMVCSAGIEADVGWKNMEVETRGAWQCEEMS
jgi:hypothetical protein